MLKCVQCDAWVAAVTVPFLLAACGGNIAAKSHAPRDGAAGAAQGEAGAGGVAVYGNEAGTDYSPEPAGNGAADGSGAGGSSAPVHRLTISPADATLKVSGVSQTLQLSAALDGRSARGAKWELDDVLVGVIDETGEFRAFGNRSGVVTVTVRYGSLSATTTIRVEADLSDNPAAVSEDDIASLRTGGGAAPDFAWLYPYDGTVFPEGLGAPLMQFSGSAADALRIVVTFSNFRYEGFYVPIGPTAEELAAGASANRADWPLRAVLTQQVWDSIVKSTRGKDDVTVSVTKLYGDQVSGPVSQRWRIADGALEGLLYYNTYNSGDGGRIMRVPFGGTVEPVMGQEGSDPSTKCTVCHSVSANGRVLVAARGWSEEPLGKNSGNPIESISFELNAAGVESVRTLDTNDGRTFAFGGLTPDGEWMLTNGVPDVPLNQPRVRGLSGYDPDEGDALVIEPQLSRLIETATGATVNVPSLSSQVQLALTPLFSPDGSALAFSWYDDSPGRTLGVASFKGDRSPAEVGAVRAVVRSEAEVLAWPSFTPDAKGLVFHAGDGYDTNRHGGGAAYAQVRLLDLDSEVVSDLAALNGLGADGTPYIPFADAGQETDQNDQALAYGTTHMNYEPNVLPVALGGYYWVFFTSRRTYGNVIAPGGALPLSDKPFGTTETSARKKIWVAAVDIDFHSKADPSHPAFYLPGQDLASGNMRAFASLAPCRGNGDSCTSGVQCCDGFCRMTDESGVTPIFACVPPPDNSCARENEACNTTADCCDIESNLCINKRCAQITPD